MESLDAATIAKLLFRNLPLRAMAWFRFGSAMKAAGIPGFAGWVQRRLLRLYGLEISTGLAIDGGLYIAHPVGCVLHAESIGANVTVISGVTFGTSSDNRWPTICDEAFFATGCRVVGGVTVGERATVGANAVVMCDVPVDATAVGVPARIIPPR